MSTRRLISTTGCAAVALVLTGCAATTYDYTNLRQHPPRSILVLPPLNESTAVEATWGYLSTVTRPLAERGYYVFPIAVVDQFLKENGLPGAGEMHQVPLPKVTEILGADAVLFITLEEYGTKYQVLNAATIVRARAKLVDTRTGILLWEGRTALQQNSSGSGNLLADVIAAALTQVLNTTSDAAHRISGQANVLLFHTKDQGLLYGPYHPKYDRGE
ncbi:MAG: DUF799 domain-containing protein [Candidatus Rokuibacteriota bacterium]